MLAALAALLTFQCLGEGVSYVFHLPVPGPVIGMLLLFGFVMMRPQTADAIEPTALELLRHLSLLFVPAGVGIMVSASRIRGDAIAVIVSIAVSTTLAIAVAALVTRALMRRQLHNDRLTKARRTLGVSRSEPIARPDHHADRVPDRPDAVCEGALQSAG
ncbi:MAG: Antiholin-like protein LrgA [uncultured Paraburkholderia sp.]|nr:MAG: Antiholin-like protein LrgA [uncultured Paraburkholderia sp.]CAH2914516.1 MAG: Antiholin-like protein LrgA [uncultured Paraburkholderia sp.]